MGDNLNSASSESLIAFGTITVIAFLIFVVWEALHGLRRGLFRQLIHIGFMVAAAIIAFVVSASLWDGVLAEFSDMSVEEMLIEVEAGGAPIAEDIRSILLSIDPEVYGYVIALPMGLLLMPFIFTMLFVVINLIFKIGYFIIRLVLGIKKRTRLGGLAVGAIEGALVACIMLFPFAALSNAASDVVATVEEDVDGETAEIIAELKVITDDPMLNFVNSIGGNAIAERFCTLEIDGEKINIREDAVLLINTLITEGGELGEADWSNLKDSEKEALRAINSSLSGSDYMATIVSGLLSGVCETLKDDPAIIDIDPPFDSFIIAAFDIFSTSNKDNIGTDVDTFLNVYFILSDEGVLSAGEDADTVELLTAKNEHGEKVIDRIIAEINRNSRMQPLVTALTKLSLSVLSNQLELGADAGQLYEDVKSAVNEYVLSLRWTEFDGDIDAYNKALSSNLDKALKEHDIVLEEKIIDDIAQYIHNQYILTGVEELTDEQFNDVILSYYDYYLGEGSFSETSYSSAVKWNGLNVSKSLRLEIMNANDTDDLLLESYVMDKSSLNDFVYEGKTYSEFSAERDEHSAYLNKLESLYDDSDNWSSDLYDEKVEYYGKEFLDKYVSDSGILLDKLIADLNEANDKSNDYYEKNKDIELAYNKHNADYLEEKLGTNIRDTVFHGFSFYFCIVKSNLIQLKAEDFNQYFFDQASLGDFTNPPPLPDN